jgi:DNA-directed RNA polymerase specialized sigma24 family protein
MLAGRWPAARDGGLRGDPAEEVAAVALAKRDLLLRVHRFRLRREDLEDCFSQATLELLMHVRDGGAFANRRHLANALELRLVSRIHDRRRALSGRSPMQAALESAAPLEPIGTERVEIADSSAQVEEVVMLRADLREIQRLARHLTEDQRRALRSQLSGETCAQFCSGSGWSAEKYRKVAQRGRTRLRSLMAGTQQIVPPKQQGRIG